MTMITGEQLKKNMIVRNGADSCFRTASYDLRAGKIINPNGEEVSSYTVPPQGIVEIISKERVVVPKNLMGFATIKTGLSTNGMLALNIGIIDPEYEGPISSFLLNFSKVPFLVSENDVFLRIYFESLDGKIEVSQSKNCDDTMYIKEKKQKIAGKFGDTFLNVDKIANDLVRGYAVKALGFVGGVALIVSLASFFANYSMVSFMRSWVDPRTSVEDGMSRKLQDDLKDRDAEIEKLKSQIDNLADEVEALSGDKAK